MDNGTPSADSTRRTRAGGTVAPPLKANRTRDMLNPGDQLPTAQPVVVKLAINPNTVLNAYRDLEREGLVRARPGQGTFIDG